MALDDILEQLGEQLVFHTSAAQRCRAAIDALLAIDPEPSDVPAPAAEATIAAPSSAARSPGRSRSEVATRAAARRVECPDCGVVLSAMGIGTHRRLRHGYTKNAPAAKVWTPERATDAIEEANGTGDE